MRKEVFCLDGALGTELLKCKGEYSFQFTDELNVISPHLVTQLHLDYLNSGAQILSTNTFNANSKAMSHHSLSSVYEMNYIGAQLASHVVDKYKTSSRLLYVAGVIGPINTPKANHKDIVSTYSTSVKGLLDGGIDCFLIETALSTKEVLGAIEAISSVSNKPIWVSLYINALGSLFSGESFTSFLSQLPKNKIKVLGFNCIPVSDYKLIQPLYKEIKTWDNSIALSLHPNVDNTNELSSTELKQMAQTVSRYAQSEQLSIVGGCCGTTPYYIKNLQKFLNKD